MKRLLVSIIPVILCSCAVLTTTQTHTNYNPAGTATSTDTTTVNIYTLGDANSTLAKLHSSQGSTNQSTYIGGLSDSTTTTNLNQIIGVVVQAAVQGALSGVK